MPVQKSSGGLANRFAKRKGQDLPDDVLGGGGNVPAGIEGGVCTLTKLVIDKYKKGTNEGKEYLMISGVVTSPTEFQGQHIAGMQVNIMEPLFDTPTRSRKTEAEHTDWARAVIKDLGVDLDDFAKPDEAIADGTVQAALIAANVGFRFRSWKGEPATAGPYKGKDPMTNYQYRGSTSSDPSASNGSYVQDDTDGAAPADEEAAAEVEGDELDALAEAAPGDPKVQAKLYKLAMDAGVSEEEFGEADWDAVPDLIRNAQGGAAGGEAAEPSIGEVYNYKAKGAKNATEHEIVAASADDVTALGEKGDEEDEDAQNLLRELGEAFKVDEPDTWAEWAEGIVAEMKDDTVIVRNCDTNVIVVNVPVSALSAS